MDLDTVTSSVCGIAHFEKLPVYEEQQKKIQSKSEKRIYCKLEKRIYCSSTLFSRKRGFVSHKILVILLMFHFQKKGRNHDLNILIIL